MKKRHHKIAPETLHCVRILYGIADMIREKERSYGSTWRYYGMTGNLTHMKEKCIRFLHHRDDTRKIPKEKFADNLKDLIVWATFTLHALYHGSVRKRIFRAELKGSPTKKELYGEGYKNYTQPELFVLMSKFYNALYIAYERGRPLNKEDVEGLMVITGEMKERMR